MREKCINEELYENRSCCVFSLTHNETGKIFYGKTITTIKEHLRKRWNKFNRANVSGDFGKLLLKDGFQNFTIEILFESYDEVELIKEKDRLIQLCKEELLLNDKKNKLPDHPKNQIELEMILKLKNIGLTNKQISRVFMVSEKSIYSRLKRHELKNEKLESMDEDLNGENG